MKRTLIVLLSLLILISCNNRIKPDSKIQIFEDYIGVQLTESMNQIVLYLDTYILNHTNSSNLDSAYNEFLEKLVNNEVDFNSITIDTIYAESLSEAEFDELFPSLLLRQTWLTIKNDEATFYYFDILKDSPSPYSIIVETIDSSKYSIEEIKKISFERQSGEHWNSYKTIIGGLKNISEGDSLISEYVEIKETWGGMNPKILSQSYLDKKVDLTNYFIKRILALEFLCHFIAKEKVTTLHNTGDQS